MAIKKISRAFEDHLDAKKILREIKLMKHFTHENVSMAAFSLVLLERALTFNSFFIHVDIGMKGDSNSGHYSSSADCGVL